ncbi:hypothetical protein IC232_27265 [Microvirga sp. BT688]|uniref:hypothetical protein n=1 Tax=Microvirga sp. TaxID=1873136 RepID=UPI001683B61C|nr:hypothetical protein [Microvirga sp.]MBD2750364.1 hypothetical protein [Microvirga sp.]
MTTAQTRATPAHPFVGAPRNDLPSAQPQDASGRLRAHPERAATPLAGALAGRIIDAPELGGPDPGPDFSVHASPCRLANILRQQILAKWTGQKAAFGRNVGRMQVPDVPRGDHQTGFSGRRRTSRAAPGAAPEARCAHLLLNGRAVEGPQGRITVLGVWACQICGRAKCRMGRSSRAGAVSISTQPDAKVALRSAGCPVCR